MHRVQELQYIRHRVRSRLQPRLISPELSRNALDGVLQVDDSAPQLDNSIGIMGGAMESEHTNLKRSGDKRPDTSTASHVVHQGHKLVGATR